MSSPALDSAPRIAALPGPSRLVRISEGTWQDLRHRLSPADSPAADVPDPRSIAELERTGLLVDGDIEPHWRAALSAALTSPVSVRLVRVDRDRAWTSDLLVAGELVVVLDQVREVSPDDDSMRLGRRSSAVLLGLTTLEWISATVESLIPQHPAFVPALADSAAAGSPPPPSTGPLAGDNPMDLTGNAAQAGPNGWSAGSEATQDAIRQLFESQNIPPGTPIMLSGHSQGGMIAESLISNPEFMAQYNVTNVVTYGSPVDNYSADPSVRQLNIQHANDAVPLIDLEGAYAAPRPTFPFITPVANLGEIAANLNIGSGNTTTATLPPPGDPCDIGGAHDGSAYQSSVQQQLQDPASQISQWSSDPSLAPFLTSDPSAVTQHTSQVHREN